MGADTFEVYSDGRDVHDAFRTAVDAVAWEHGHGGYTGTIAEKSEFVIITKRAMSYDDATRMADDLLNRDDSRVADKWGPAGAIPVKKPTRTVRLDNLPARALTGRPSEHVAEMSRIARDRQLVTDAETVTKGDRLTSDSFSLTVTKDPAVTAAQTEPDGWLFFGWASS
ncbi:hypothetical protein [Rugosimonospora acidiphila]|uniref:hypothetical protein n=1 Tax=Rugosimonospora acidiphila TaxID=556531 RepID=UPI0031F0FBED